MSNPYQQTPPPSQPQPPMIGPYQQPGAGPYQQPMAGPYQQPMAQFGGYPAMPFPGVPTRKRSIVGPLILVVVGLLGCVGVFLPIVSGYGLSLSYFNAESFFPGSSEAATFLGIGILLLGCFGLILVLAGVAAIVRNGALYITTGIFAILGGAVSGLVSFLILANPDISEYTRYGVSLGAGLFLPAAMSVLAVAGGVVILIMSSGRAVSPA